MHLEAVNQQSVRMMGLMRLSSATAHNFASNHLRSLDNLDLGDISGFTLAGQHGDLHPLHPRTPPWDPPRAPGSALALPVPPHGSASLRVLHNAMRETASQAEVEATVVIHRGLVELGLACESYDILW